MKHKKLLVACLVLLVLIGGAIAWRMSTTVPFFLKHSDVFVFYTIKPSPMDWSNEKAERFRNHEVLGKVTITDPSEKAALVDALFPNRNFKKVSLSFYACHSPRHAIRATRNGHVVEASICFQCQNYIVYKDGAKILDDPMFDDSVAHGKSVFNQAVARHHLPLAKE